MVATAHIPAEHVSFSHICRHMYPINPVNSAFHPS